MADVVHRSDLLAFLQCERRLWLENRPQELAPGHLDARIVRADEGQRIEALAHTRYPDGVDLRGAPWDRVQAALNDPAVRTVYGAVVHARGYKVRLDILVRTTGPWTHVDVRSGLKVKRGHLFDVSVRRSVAAAAGLSIDRSMICHMRRASTDAPPSAERNLRVVDVTHRLTEIDLPDASSLKHARDQPEEPSIAVGEHCTGPWRCPYMSRCGAGTMAWARPPSGAAHAVDAEHEYISDELIDLLPSGPVYSLDFEALQTPLPVAPGIRPFEPLPFLWVARRSDADTSHVFTSHAPDPRRAFTESLLTALQGSHTVLVWSDYESTTLARLARQLPDLRDALGEFIERLVDLHALVRRGFWHPDLGGQYSVKAVAKAVCADFDYSDLAIDNGRDAALIGLGLQRGLLAERRKQDLVDYCERDVIAVQRVWQHLDAARTQRTTERPPPAPLG